MKMRSIGCRGERCGSGGRVNVGSREKRFRYNKIMGGEFYKRVV